MGKSIDLAICSGIKCAIGLQMMKSAYGLPPQDVWQGMLGRIK